MSERKPIKDVNIELGDDVSKMLYNAAAQTYDNRPGLVKEFHKSFSGVRGIRVRDLPDPLRLIQNMGFDGVGTKVEIAERTKDHSTIAYDLFAMVCDDAVVRGAESLTLGTILDVNQLDDRLQTREAVEGIARGYVGAAAEAGVVVVNGEVAELGDRVGGHGDFNYNWGAAVTWFAHEDRLLTGEEIQPGDSLVGFTEHGFRSNGITDVRKAMLEKYGEDWQDVVDRELGDVALGQLILRPSIIYSRLVSSLTGGFDITREPRARIHGAAHITGGGQPSKLGRMLEPSGFGAIIDEPIAPPKMMKAVQEIRGLSDEKAYGKWHMGPGMIIATPEPDVVIAVAEEFDVEAKRIGEVMKVPGVVIKNEGAGEDSRYVSFPRI